MTYHIVWHNRNPECTQMIPAWRLPVLTLMDINYCLNHDRDLSNVYEWLSAKTEFMLIASRQKLSQFTESPSLTINENAIEKVHSAKTEVNHKLPFLDVLLDNSNPPSLVTSVFRKSTYTGLLANFFSFTPFPYKLGLIRTLVDRTFKINNTWIAFTTTSRNLPTF